MKKRSASYSRNKGHSAEREYAKRFRELGFGFCRTSRQASRLLDDSKVDLSGIPFLVQIKAGYKNNRPKPDVIFGEMKTLLTANFPPGEVHAYPKVLIHDIGGSGEESEMVTMMWKDWIELLKAYKQVKNL